MDTENWIAVGAGVVAVVAAWISFNQARHAKTEAQAAVEQAAIARRQLEQTEKAHREQNEPYVIVDIQPDAPGSGLLVLVIENIGPTIARDVTISVNPPLTSASGDNLAERLRTGLSRTIPMLPPGRRLKYAFDIAHRRFASDLPTAYTFTVQAKGPFGHVEPLEYLVDFSSWQETLLGEHPDTKAVGALSDMADSLSGLAKAYQGANASAIRAEREAGAARFRRQSEPDDSTPQ
ncbi:hypothetical protein [Streptomyces scabiei]|uniref:hypothetical protein n=1 Tax=Streptomyces scabiei TaxID=1930 RepID=UPI0029AEB844|nr:hypothetical protein [Streptomyces scabiei]MDX3027461.1 hypothetical protein [Streptomyces scabiei]